MAEFDTTNATATADDILNGKTAYVKGEKIKGTIQSKLGGSFMPTTESQVICPAGVYTSSAYSIKGDANLKPSNIRKDVEIFGVTGIMQGNDAPSGTLPDNMRTISVEPNDYRNGTVYGGGGASKGMTVTVSANPIGKHNFFGWEENGKTVSEDAEYAFQVEKSRNLKALFGDTHKPLPDGYTEVEWIQNADYSSYISTGKSLGESLYLEVSFPNGKGSNYNRVIEGSAELPYLCTNPAFHWYYLAGSGTSTMLTQRTLSSGNEIDGITKINIIRSSSSFVASSITINGTINSFSNTSSVGISGITIPSSTPSSSQIMRIHYIKGTEGSISSRIYNFELIPCISPQNIVGLYDVVNDEFIPPTTGRFITVYDGNFYTISLTNSNPQWGTISGSGSYEEGASVTVAAEPNEGYKFVAWKENGEVVSNSEAYTFTVERDRQLVAEFAVRPSYLISVDIEPDGSGSVSGQGRYYDGEDVSLVATANGPYKFSEWKENGESVSKNAKYVFTADRNRGLIAEFFDDFHANYTEVSYIQFDSGCGIDTLFKPNATTTRIVMDIECVGTPTLDSFIFATYGENVPSIGWRYFSCFVVNSSTIGYRDNSASYKSLSVDFSKRFTVDYDCPNGKVSIGGSTGTISKGSYSFSNKLFIGAQASSDKSIPCKLYSAQIYANGDKVLDFVPCKNKSGVAGLYDFVSGKFFENSWNGTITAGPTI